MAPDVRSPGRHRAPGPAIGNQQRRRALRLSSNNGTCGPAPIIAGAPANLAVRLSYRALPPTAGWRPGGLVVVASAARLTRWSPRVVRTLALGSFVLAAT